MSEHTPGPWKAVPADGGSGGYAIWSDSDASGAVIFICDTGQPFLSDMEQIKANARLIAAAPMLLRALEDIADMIGKHESLMRRVALAAVRLTADQSNERDAHDGAMSCSGQPFLSDMEQIKANARLIEKAPDLLDAAIRVLNEHSGEYDFDYLIDVIQQIIPGWPRG